MYKKDEIKKLKKEVGNLFYFLKNMVEKMGYDVKISNDIIDLQKMLTAKDIIILNKKNTIRFLRDEKEKNYIIIDDFSDLIIGKIFIKNGGVEGFIEIGGKRFNAKTYCGNIDFAIDIAIRDTKRYFEKEFNLYTNT